MSARVKGGKRGSRKRTARRRRRLVRMLGALVGSVLAATAGWLYAGARPTAADRPVVRAAALEPSTGLALGPPELPDPVVRGGALQVPILDWTEVLPSCH